MKRPWQPLRTVCIIVLLMCLFARVSYAIICYKCTIKPPEYVGDPDQPCSQFDGSARFQENCPASTFCMKRIIHLQLPNRTMTNISERNCASQKYEIRKYNYTAKMWQTKESIDTQAYKDGCFYEEDRGTPNGPSQYCYCSSDYCNKSSPNYNSMQFQTTCLLVTVVLLVLGTS